MFPSNFLESNRLWLNKVYFPFLQNSSSPWQFHTYTWGYYLLLFLVERWLEMIWWNDKDVWHKNSSFMLPNMLHLICSVWSLPQGWPPLPSWNNLFWLSWYYSLQRFLLLHYLLWFSLMCYLLLLFTILNDEKSLILYFLLLLQSSLGEYINPHDSETNTVIQIFMFSFLWSSIQMFHISQM